ncbi:zinc finger, CCHC-type containing protein [Tanacetum coccineum]
MITHYELWTKRKPNLNYLRVWGCRAVVRLLDPKLKTLGERGIEFIFVGYVEHSKDAIFDENRFSLFPRPSLNIPNKTEDLGGSVVHEKVTKEDVAFWKEAINDEIDSIMAKNIWVLADLPPGCKLLDCKWIFKSVTPLQSNNNEKVTRGATSKIKVQDVKGVMDSTEFLRQFKFV